MESRPPGNIDQKDQTVGHQINAVRDVNIHHHGPAAAREGRSGIDAIESEFGQCLRDLERCYVTPNLQDFNPPDEMNSPSLIVSRQPAFQVVSDFIGRPGLAEGGQRCLFILGDAGMGKTSLLLMLACRRQSQPPDDGFDCVLMKLGPDTLDRLARVRNPGRTLLLLDSLDEDPAAHDHGEGAQGRLLELLPKLAGFHRVVLTCRSQYFPENSPHLTTLPGHFVIGNHECPLKYISLFNDGQVEDYLVRRYKPRLLARIIRAFSGEEDPKLAEARKAAKSMESLRLRPLLLSRIDDFVGRDDRPGVDFGNSYAVYHRLVDQWLMRDAEKPLGMTLEESWRVAVLLALQLTRSGLRKISSEELAGLEGLREIPRFKLEARSLLNRNKDREFQFAHATIQEFLFAHAILHHEPDFDVAGLELTRVAFRFLQDGKKLKGQVSLDLHGAKADFPDAAIELIEAAFGLQMVALPPGEFLMGSPASEIGRGDDETQHRVRITQPFWIGRYPVTLAEYQAVMGENPSHFKGDRRPVACVDWHQAMEFCARVTERARADGSLPEGLTFRLPTEAEWEYACRAGTAGAFNDGSSCTKPDGKDPALMRLGWFRENSKSETHPVGEKVPNAWGLFDMHGNVFQWCLDGLRAYADQPVNDPLGPTDGAGRVVRGGCCGDQARLCRAAFRSRLDPCCRWGGLGLRLAAGQEPWRGAPSRQAGGAGAPWPEAPAGPASGASRRSEDTSDES